MLWQEQASRWELETAQGGARPRVLRLPVRAAHHQADPEVPSGPDPLFEKPAPITLAELAQRKTLGVTVAEVSDYAPARYQG